MSLLVCFGRLRVEFLILLGLFLMAAAASALLPARGRAAVVGGSLGGLAVAHALQQTGWKVDVLERSPAPMSQKGSGLGYVHTPSWESLVQKPMLRRNRRANRAQGSFYYGDLWKFLYENIPNKNNNDNDVTIRFGTTVTNLEGSVEEPIIDGVSYDLVVVSDGGFSALRHHVVGKDAVPEYAGYVVWRGSVSATKLSPNLLQEIRYMEGVYKSGIYDLIVLKMAKDSGEDLWTMGTFIATPESELSQYWDKEKDTKARHTSKDSNFAVPRWFPIHMAKNFGHVPGLVPLIEQMLTNGEVKAHPQYEFGALDRVHKGRVLLIGDAAHMASPRTAVGAHTAILDALALREAMKDHADIDTALGAYSHSGVAHARQLYARTREVSGEFVPAKGLDAIVSPEELYAEFSKELIVEDELCPPGDAAKSR